MQAVLDVLEEIAHQRSDLALACPGGTDLIEAGCHITRPVPEVRGHRQAGYIDLVNREPPVIYHGPCMLVEVTVPGSGMGDGPANLRRFRLSLPIMAAPMVTGDEVTITECRRQPHMAGAVLRVAETVARTFAVTRVIICEPLLGPTTSSRRD